MSTIRKGELKEDPALWIDKAFIDILHMNKKLTPIDKFVLIEVCEHLGKEAAPSQKELSEIINISDRALRNSLKKLSDLGWIEKKQCKDEKLQTYLSYHMGEHLKKVIEEVL